MAQDQKSKKSALRALRPSEILFREGDPAKCLYIIQKGQLRLFRPKGKGFVELAVLRAGEVIGEMAYFAEEESEKRRSCSAQAIVSTQIIEISFVAFAKTMANLNPWFKTIIQTLAARLRKTNSMVKELDSNSVSLGYGGSSAGYSFFKNIELVRLLSLTFLAVKSHGRNDNGRLSLAKSALKYYVQDAFGIAEVKFEEFITLLEQLGHLEIETDEKGKPNLLQFNNIATLRDLFIFLNKQRTAADDKQIKISPRCEIFLDHILMQLAEKNCRDDKAMVDITTLMNEFRSQSIHVDLEDLNQAKDQGLVSDIVVGEQNRLSCQVNQKRLKEVFLPLQFTNAVERINRRKQQAK